MLQFQRRNDYIRVTKSPEERRHELINIAEQLFLKKGYKNTMVSDIVKQAGVAQGTFYYYFKSKEAVLDEITDKYISIIIRIMDQISKDKNLNPIEKLVKIFYFSLTFSDDTKGIMQHVHDDKNLQLQHKFKERIPIETVGPLAHIFKEGVDEGIFDTQYPEDAAKAFNGISGMVLQGLDDQNPEQIKRKFMVIFDFIERILGTESGKISIAFIERIK